MQMEGSILDRTLLVLGAGPDQIPGILKAKEMGVYTIALDGNENADGATYANEFYKVSIKHFEQIEQFIKTYTTRKIDGVIAFGVDIASIIAKTADLLGVNYTCSEQSTTLSENKYLSKEFMLKHNINIPHYQKIHSIEEMKHFASANNFPVILKPIDNSAARGISFISSSEDIKNAFEEALVNTKQDYLLTESFLAGPQISSESFIIDGEVYNIGFADRNYDDLEKFLPNIIENGGDLPSIYMDEKHKLQLYSYLKTISQELNIQNGIIKGDLVIHNDELYIIEFALRLSGGNFSTIEIPYSTGVDFLKIAILLHLGLPIEKEDLEIKSNKSLSLRYKFAEELTKGKIKEILKPLEKENIIYENFHFKVGDTLLQKTANHASRLGFAIATGDGREEAIENAQKYLDSVEITLE
jgi:biotin carboxylase